MSGGSYIIRHLSLQNFTHLNNELICDRRLSWKELGLLVFLLHFPPDFKLHLSYIAQMRGARGTRESATTSAFAGLVAAHYMKKELVRDERGRIIEVVWHVADQPIFHQLSKEENPELENQDLDKHDLENRGLQSTNSSNNEVNKEREERKRSSKPLSFAADKDKEARDLAFARKIGVDASFTSEEIESVMVSVQYPSQAPKAMKEAVKKKILQQKLADQLSKQQKPFTKLPVNFGSILKE